MSNTKKIIAEIQRLKKDLDGYSAEEALDHIESYINLNSREPSVPSNLDEAAEKYAWKKEEPLAEGERLSFCFNPRIDAFKAGAEWMAGQEWKEVSEADYPKPDKDKLYCVHTEQHYLLATVILHPYDDGLCQWRCTEFPHHRYDMREGDRYVEIRKK